MPEGYRPSVEDSKDYKEKHPTRRAFLGLGMAAASAYMAKRLLHESGNKTDSAPNQILSSEQETELSGKIPDFVLEKNKNEYNQGTPENVEELINEAWDVLEPEEVGHEVKKVIIIPKKKSKQNTKGKTKPIIKNKMETNFLLATKDFSETDSPEIHLIRLNSNGVPETEGHTVDIGRDLGMGTSYEVSLPRNHAVLAVKRTIPLEGKYQEVIYTPYSPEIDTPKLREAGFNYLKDLLKSAGEDLNASGVHSLLRGEKGELQNIASQVPKDLALKLTIIEQVDPKIFERDSARLAKKYGVNLETAEIHIMKKMAQEGLAVVGANKEDARIYSRSNVGASGLFQLMPETYNSLALGRRIGRTGLRYKPDYKNTGLDARFASGATDHLNAAKAALLLLDSDLRNGMSRKSLRQNFAKDPGLMGVYLAACYNAGSSPVIKTMRKFGPKSWTEHLPIHETRVYVRKYHALEAVYKGNFPPLPEKPAL
jgi:hypothetical protein